MRIITVGCDVSQAELVVHAGQSHLNSQVDHNAAIMASQFALSACFRLNALTKRRHSGLKYRNRAPEAHFPRQELHFRA